MTVTRYRMPKSARIVSTEDFGKVIRAADPQLRLGRDAVSLCAMFTQSSGRVRFGFTVGKHNVPRAVDRVLAKRVMREVARHKLPEIKAVCERSGVGIDISLRIRERFVNVGTDTTVAETKERIRKSTEKSVVALQARLATALEENRKC